MTVIAGVDPRLLVLPLRTRRRPGIPVHLAFVGDVDAFVTFDRAFAKRAKKAKSKVTVEAAH